MIASEHPPNIQNYEELQRRKHFLTHSEVRINYLNMNKDMTATIKNPNKTKLQTNTLFLYFTRANSNIFASILSSLTHKLHTFKPLSQKRQRIILNFFHSLLTINKISTSENARSRTLIWLDALNRRYFISLVEMKNSHLL